ncbi:unnamed protein product [Ectocarpus sp. CCAP 1310/34]|nr:unnamed protein product [Ectocarpus sp. CCAP 1310/34]
MSYADSRGGGAGGPNGLLPEYNSVVGAWVLEVSSRTVGADSICKAT